MHTFDDRGRLRSLLYGDVFRGGGDAAADRAEVEVFVRGNDLDARFARLTDETFTIGETGFGTGLSFACAAARFVATAPTSARLHFVSVEAHPLGAASLARCHAEHPELRGWFDALRERWPHDGAFGADARVVRMPFAAGRVVLFLLLGCAESVLAEHPFAADAWFLDGFAPARNPAMWSEATLGAVAANTRGSGTFATWCSASAVRARLERVGFACEKLPGTSRKREITRGTRTLGGAARAQWITRPDPGARSTRHPRRVEIHGAGLAGAATARALAQRGVEVQVIVPAATEPEFGAADLPLGVLQPRLWFGHVPDAEFVAEAFRWVRETLRADPTLAEAARWQPCGALHLATNEAAAARLQRRVEGSRRALCGTRAPFVDVEWLDAASANSFARRDDLLGAAWIASAGVLDPRALVRHLLAHPQIRVAREPADGPVDARVFAVGAGAGSRAELQDLTIDVVRGHLLQIDTHPTSTVRAVLCDEGHLTPEFEGAHYCGATFRSIDADSARSPLPDDVAINLARARRLAPHLSIDESNAAGWIGERAVTTDHLPYVGRIANRVVFEREFGASLVGRAKAAATPSADVWTDDFAQLGHGSRGLATAPFAGELLAALLCGEVVPLRESLLRRLSTTRAIVRRLRQSRSS